MRRCRECGSSKDTHPAGHYVGGNYRRPSRWYRSTICRACAVNLLQYATEGHATVSCWSVSNLRQIAATS